MTTNINNMIATILKQLPELTMYDLKVMPKDEIIKYYNQLMLANTMAYSNYNHMDNNQKYNKAVAMQNKRQGKIVDNKNLRLQQYGFNNKVNKKQQQKNAITENKIVKTQPYPQKANKKYVEQNKNINKQIKQKKIHKIHQQSTVTKEHQKYSTRNDDKMKEQNKKANILYENIDKNKDSFKILSYTQQILDDSFDQFCDEQYQQQDLQDYNSPTKANKLIQNKQPQIDGLQWLKKLKHTLEQLQSQYLSNFTQVQIEQAQE